MSTTKSFASFFFLVVFFLHEYTHNVNAVPLQKPSTTKLNAAKFLPPGLHSPKKPSPRFFGKFSFLAGLGLPDPVTQPPIKREDLLYERLPPTHYTVGYNFPPVRWGPYIAAVYEPSPAFLHNPLGYLAAALNPFNWFGNGGSTTSTSRPESIASMLTTHGPDSNKNQQTSDVLVFVHEPENEIPDDDRISFADKMEMKTEREEFSTEQIKKSMSTIITLETTTKMYDVTTEMNDEDMNMDLIAEETTIKLIEHANTGQRFNDQSRQRGEENRERPYKGHRERPHEGNRERPHEGNREREDRPHERDRENQSRPNEEDMEYEEDREDEGDKENEDNRKTTTTVRPRPTRPSTLDDTTSKPPRTTTKVSETTLEDNSTSTVTPTANATLTTSGSNNATMNATTQTPIPSQNTSASYPNFYPGYYNGYYYGGYPQNVSHVEFTTPNPVATSTTTTAAPPVVLHNFNDQNQYEQQYPGNYYDTYEAQPQTSFDYYSRYDQFPPKKNEYYGKNREFLTNSVNNVDNLNGFKPSFPYYH